MSTSNSILVTNVPLVRLETDVCGIFRYVLLTNTQETVEELLQEAENDFEQTYNLSVLPRFMKIQLENEVITDLTKLKDNSKISLIPDNNFVEELKKTPWQVIGIEETEFEVRIELMRKVFGEESNIGVLRSCLLRASGNLGKAIAVGSYIRPDIIGTTKKVVFVRNK